MPIEYQIDVPLKVLLFLLLLDMETLAIIIRLIVMDIELFFDVWVCSKIVVFMAYWAGRSLSKYVIVALNSLPWSYYCSRWKRLPWPSYW